MWWSNDGGTQSEALAYWVELESGPGSIQNTEAEQIGGAYEYGCIHVEKTEILQVKFGGLVRQGDQRFASVKRKRLMRQPACQSIGASMSLHRNAAQGADDLESD